MPDGIHFRNRYRIPSARLASWDYRWAGVYYVTICTEERVCWFGEVMEDQVNLSREGRVIAEEWRRIPQSFPHVTLDEWIIMPDHMHGILVFQNPPHPQQASQNSGRLLARSLGAVIAQFKSNATKRIRKDLMRAAFDWQERFYDSILRDPGDLEQTRAYIRANPIRWTLKRSQPRP